MLERRRRAKFLSFFFKIGDDRKHLAPTLARWVFLSENPAKCARFWRFFRKYRCFWTVSKRKTSFSTTLLLGNLVSANIMINSDEANGVIQSRHKPEWLNFTKIVRGTARRGAACRRCRAAPAACRGDIVGFRIKFEQISTKIWYSSKNMTFLWCYRLEPYIF